MYNFIDVTETSEGVVLPSEALKINGEYIENQVKGYRTLNVSGREALSPELDTFSTGIRDGTTLKSKRFPDRIILVSYQLRAETNEDFRNAYNKLAAILNVEDAELIFNDEPDKFFVGTPSAIGDVEPGTNSVIGEFEILCADPFKYSVMEYEAEPSLDESSALIDYNGTYKAFPILEADFYSDDETSQDGETVTPITGAGDCGFVAFFNENEKIIQLGDPEEEDGTNPYAKSQTLVNNSFKSKTSWGTAAKKLWAVNGGNTTPSIVQAGSVGMGVASYAVPANPPSTSGTLVRVTSRAGAPHFNYKVLYKTTNRTAKTAKVTFAITGALARDASYFLSGYGLVASVFIGGSWHDVTLKKPNDRWRGKTAHTVNMAVNVSGLAASAISISGIKFKVSRSDNFGGRAGILNAMNCPNIPISPYVADVPETYYLHPTSYGAATGKWHGPTITRTIPADASGTFGADNFTLTYRQKMCVGKSSGDAGQLGAFQAQIIDGSGGNIAGVRVLKNKAGKKASLVFYIKGTKVYDETIDLSYNNKFFGSKESAVRTSKIAKSGNKITFSVGGTTKVFRDDSVKSLVAKKVTFAFEQYSAAKTLANNGIYWVKFVKDNCNTYKDVPNKFSANDVVTADCRNGEILLNGVPSPGLGALGNDWEDFCLVPGLNQIGFAYSSWVAAEYAPKIKVRYREVFL